MLGVNISATEKKRAREGDGECWEGLWFSLGGQGRPYCEGDP